MIYTTLIKKAISFAIQVHEIDQKQKRKGKDIAYIVHPLSVGLILAQSGASEEVVAAGILHDTIEDSITEKKVTKEMLTERFGENVAELVASVTEFSKELPWEVRKQEALEHIKNFSHDSLLIKSADILSNASELLDDYEKNGELIFTRFNAPKEKIIENYFRTITAILDRWAENQLADDLKQILIGLEKMTNKPNAGLFVGFIINEKDSSYEVYLVNSTKKNYCRVFVLSGAYCGDDDGLLETSKVTKEKGPLPPHSFQLLERSDLDGLDFVIWFHLDIYEDAASEPIRVWFELPKYGGLNSKIVRLSVLEKEGTLIELETRNDGETIEEEIQHLNMNGVYHKSSGA